MGFVEDERFREFNARCVFFNRHGGVSPEPFSSLNFSTTVGDSPENVNKNFEIAKNVIAAKEIKTVNQIHSNRIVEYSENKESADGIFTNKRGIFLAIKFADCLPIALMDVREKIVMAIHAGWKGTYLKISKMALEQFISLGCKPENIIITIGPHICKNCYEVKEDVSSKFDNKFITTKDGKIFLDLSSANKEQFKEMGVPEENIKDLNICTFENKDFFSYRRDSVCGRNMGGIMLVDNY